VVPTGKDDPDGGVQVVETGASPPDTVGEGKPTVAADVVVSTLTADGQVTVIPVDGEVGLSAHATPVATTRASAERLNMGEITPC
jgi:hypothetical protein